MAFHNASNISPTISAPLEVINDTDQGGLVSILAGFALSLVLISLPIRIYVRTKMSRPGMDDYAFLGACLFSIFQAAAVFYELHLGLGKTADLLDQTEIVPMQKTAYASDILYIFALAFSKFSTAFLFLRLTPGRGHAVAVKATISLSMVWALVSLLLVAFRCHPLYPWFDIDSTCENLFVRWEVICALDVLTEVALFAMSIYLVWAVVIPLRSKAVVVAAFGCRLPVIAIAGLRLYFVNKQILSSDPTFVAAWTVCCTQLEIGYSIVASIIPCLKNFMAAYEPPSTNQYQYYQSGKNSNYMLSSMASKPDGNAAAPPPPPQPQPPAERALRIDDPHVIPSGTSPTGTSKSVGRLRPEQMGYEARVTHYGSEESRRSADSENSQRMIIKKGVEWSVDYNTRNRSSSGAPAV